MMRTVTKTQVTLLALVFIVTIPVSSYGVDGQRQLSQPVSPATFPITINQSGSYVLTSNLVVSDPNQHAIEIIVNDVTIDLNGHMIRGPSNQEGNGSGIYAGDKYTIAIKNGRIWGFAQLGVYLGLETQHHPSLYGAGHLVENIQAVNNGLTGIYVTGGLVTNCIANGNGDTGINGNYSTITNCTANANVVDGIYSFNSSIVNCTTARNGRYGIQSAEDAITNCSSSWNQSTGIFAASSSIINSAVNYNSHDGIRATSCTITNCLISDNNDNGITADGDNRIEGNSLNSNGRDGTGHGIHVLTGTYGDYVVKNTVRHSTTNNFQNDGSSNYMPITPAGGDNANYWP